jgi:hypothetical protein
MYTIIDFLYITHCSIFNNISETGLCLRLQVIIMLSWTKSVELVSISGHQNKHKAGCINQTKHESSAEVKTEI